MFSLIPKTAPDDVSFEEPIAFSWWLLKEIGPLYKFDVAGKIVFKHGVSKDPFDSIAQCSRLLLPFFIDPV